MKEQLISFETAKLAKKKGFVIDPILSTKFYASNGRLCNATFDFDDSYIAPTQSLLQKWLREEHSIHMWFHMINKIPLERLKEKGIKRFRVNLYCENWNPHIPSFEDIQGDTYEEALEDGLFHALKLILNESL